MEQQHWWNPLCPLLPQQHGVLHCWPHLQAVCLLTAASQLANEASDAVNRAVQCRKTDDVAKWTASHCRVLAGGHDCICTQANSFCEHVKGPCGVAGGQICNKVLTPACTAAEVHLAHLGMDQPIG